VYRAISEVRKLLKKSKVIVPGQLELEISHHYGTAATYAVRRQRYPRRLFSSD
jgi:hypothetical protein